MPVAFVQKYYKILALMLGIIAVIFILFQLIPQNNGAELQGEPAKQGDTINVLFVGMLENGSIFASNIEQAARAGGFYKPQTQYGPSPITIGSPEVLIGISEGLEGMRINEMKKIIISPEKAYGVHDPQKFVYLSRMAENERSVSIGRYVEIPKEKFTSMFESADPQKLIFNVSGVEHLFVEERNDSYVYELNLSLHDNITLPGTSWDSSVYIIGPTRIVALQEVEEGTFYQTASGIIKVTNVTEKTFTTQLQVEVGNTVSTRTVQGIVTELNETHMKVDVNHPLAGKTLVYELKRVE